MEKQAGKDLECQRMMVFIGQHFPNGKKVKLVDNNHFLNNRNVILDQKTKKFYEIRCFERRGLHFFGQRVLNSNLSSHQTATCTQ
jgi:hypothetical protein